MDRLETAFSNTDRRIFIPEYLHFDADLDMPLPIGYGQTNSQPTTVQLMLTWLDVKPGQKVLDVGSGSGWTTALLAYLVGNKGMVYAVELVPELVEFGKDNCQKAGVTNAEFHVAGEVFGLPEHAPYDRILVSAGSDEVPEELFRQLVPGGKMVIPVGSDILEITKFTDMSSDTVVHPGFVFVPLIKSGG